MCPEIHNWRTNWFNKQHISQHLFVPTTFFHAPTLIRHISLKEPIYKYENSDMHVLWPNSGINSITLRYFSVMPSIFTISWDLLSPPALNSCEFARQASNKDYLSLITPSHISVQTIVWTQYVCVSYWHMISENLCEGDGQKDQQNLMDLLVPVFLARTLNLNYTHKFIPQPSVAQSSRQYSPATQISNYHYSLIKKLTVSTVNEHAQKNCRAGLNCRASYDTACGAAERIRGGRGNLIAAAYDAIIFKQ